MSEHMMKAIEFSNLNNSGIFSNWSSLGVYWLYTSQDDKETLYSAVDISFFRYFKTIENSKEFF